MEQLRIFTLREQRSTTRTRRTIIVRPDGSLPEDIKTAPAELVQKANHSIEIIHRLGDIEDVMSNIQEIRIECETPSRFVAFIDRCLSRLGWKPIITPVAPERASSNDRCR